MTIEYLRYTIDGDRQDAFVNAYTAAADPLFASEYCLGFELCRCDDDSSQYIIRIEWTSADDHLGRFRKSPEFRAFLVHIKPYIDDIDEMRHYTRLASRPLSE